MKTYLEKKIIHLKEQQSLNPLIKEDKISYLFTYASFIGFGLLYMLYWNKAGFELKLFSSLISLAVALSSILTTTSFSDFVFFPKNLAIDFLFYLPIGNKSGRVEELNHFIEANKEKIQEALAIKVARLNATPENRQRTPTVKPKSLNELLEEEFLADPKVFVQTHFNNSQSFIRSFLEKAFDEGYVNRKFLISAYLVPRRKEINPESFKKILIAIYGSSDGEEISLSPRKDAFENSFVNYRLEQIESLFLKKFKYSDFKRVYEKVCNDLVVLEVFDSFQTISKNLFAKKGGYLEKKYLKIEKYNFSGRLLRFDDEYKKAGKQFSNCVAGYFSSSNNIVIFEDSDKNPVACVEVDSNGRIVQISGYNNRSISEDLKYEISQLLRKE